MTEYYKHWSEWRNRVRERIYHIMGGKCVICGYNKCKSALDFHHINPHEKKFRIADIGRGSIKWETLLTELRKCVILCSNCHREFHAGLIEIVFIPSFDESKVFDFLPTCQRSECNNKVPTLQSKYCCKECTRLVRLEKAILKKPENRKKETIWSTVDVIELLRRNNGNMWNSGKEVGLTDNAVKKRFQKITGFKNWREYQQHESQSVRI